MERKRREEIRKGKGDKWMGRKEGKKRKGKE